MAQLLVGDLERISNFQLWDASTLYCARHFFPLVCCFYLARKWLFKYNFRIDMQRCFLTNKYLALALLVSNQLFLSKIIPILFNYILLWTFYLFLFYTSFFHSYSLSGCVARWLAPSKLLSFFVFSLLFSLKSRFLLFILYAW